MLFCLKRELNKTYSALTPDSKFGTMDSIYWHDFNVHNKKLPEIFGPFKMNINGKLEDLLDAVSLSPAKVISDNARAVFQ